MANSNTGNGESLKWYQKLRVKYKLIIRRQDTYEERVSVQLSRMKVLIYTGAFAILMIVLTSLLIAYTPLKEYIPGQTETETRRQLYELQKKTDSLENAFRQKSEFVNNIRTVLNGGSHPNSPGVVRQDSVDYQEIELQRSQADSALRDKIENQRGSYSLAGYGQESSLSTGSMLYNNFFNPLSGIVTNRFKPSKGHYGIDIVADSNEAIKAVLGGSVILANWTTETGYVIALQHHGNYISVYKHNSVLLKSQGEHVNAGEAIAIVGESGELTTGPHLHFELWYKGRPVNPENYILF